MPKLTKEEREEKKRLLEAKREARRQAKAKKETEKAATLSKNVKDSSTPAKGKDNNAQQQKNLRSYFLELPEDATQQVLSFLPAKELGATCSTCSTLNKMLVEARVPYIVSRLHRPNFVIRDGVGSIDMCSDEADARKLIQQSFQGGETGRVLNKRGKKGIGADEFVGFARYIEQAVSGYCTLSTSRNPPALPRCVNGRFASVSPEHSLCRVGGDGALSGPGGSGVASWGVGKRGQLGHGKREDEKEPRMLLGKIGYGIRIVQVSAGGGLVRVAHSLLLTSTGRVLSFGTAQYGALGHGYGSGKQLSDEMRPRYIDALSHVRCTCVSAGELHSAVVTTDGDVYTWGDGFCGQLGLGDKRPQLLPRQVENGGLEDECVSSISCGNRHTLCVTEDGEVFSFGLGHFGVLGRSFTPFQYDADAAVVALGVEDHDPVGMVMPGEVPAPPQIPAPVVAQETDAAFGEVGGDQPNGMSDETRAQLDLIANLTLDDNSDQCIPKLVDSLVDVPIVGVSAGHRHSIFLDANGGVYTCGSGVSGALGHGDFVSQAFPMRVMEFVDENVKILQISAGVDMSMCTSTAGDVYAWGKTEGGRIGLDDNAGNVTIPRRVYLEDSNGENLKAADVECGYVHSLVVGLNGTIHQCGRVGTHGSDDGQTVEDSSRMSDGRPVPLENFNIWHRIPEPKENVKKEKWKKYGKYELKGRRTMLEEAERRNR